MLEQLFLGKRNGAYWLEILKEACRKQFEIVGDNTSLVYIVQLSSKTL
jgi:hypothetical protein